MMDSKVKMVCIVDDDKVYRFTTEKYIHMLNLPITVLMFSDGEEVYTYLKNNKGNKEKLPDIILLDLNMPIMDGWDFLDEYEGIKSQLSKDIKIYLVSSSTDERDQNRSKEYSSVSGYLVKPLNEKYLEQLIKQ